LQKRPIILRSLALLQLRFRRLSGTNSQRSYDILKSRMPFCKVCFIVRVHGQLRGHCSVCLVLLRCLVILSCTHCNTHCCTHCNTHCNTHCDTCCNTADMSFSKLSYIVMSCMGWLRVLGSIKLHVSFAEYSLVYRALLQKKPIILRSLLIVATP